MKLEDVLKGNNVINCKTMEEADRLFKATPNIESIKRKQVYEEQTTYNPNNKQYWSYADIDFYKERGYNIINFSDIDEFKTDKTRYFKCTKQLGTEKYFTVGEVYEVTDKRFISDRRHNYIDSYLKSVDEVIEFLRVWYEFEEIKKEEKKEMNKFKVGDMVKGKTGSKKRYAITNEYMTKGEVVGVNGDDEIKVKVLEHSTDKNTIGDVWWVDKELFELVTPSKKSIHITFDETTTHAVVKEDGKVVKREKVGLCRGDVYDEATGVREVIDKVYGKKVEKTVQPKFIKDNQDSKTELWRCVSKDEDCGLNFTVGTIYERRFVDGRMNMDDDINRNFWVLNPKDEFRGVKFERVKNTTKSISSYTTDELLSEIKRRTEK